MEYTNPCVASRGSKHPINACVRTKICCSLEVRLVKCRCEDFLLCSCYVHANWQVVVVDWQVTFYWAVGDDVFPFYPLAGSWLPNQAHEPPITRTRRWLGAMQVPRQSKNHLLWC